MSFGLEDACNKKVIEGSYRLLSYPEGRLTNGLINPDLHHAPEMGENGQEACCGESVVIEEVLSADGVETELKRSTNRAILSEQQKYADEHLFLRYLELDPIEGPDAIPAAMQRKATGNKSGRTPFTQTKRLVRPAKSGFGFSVVWTHPPRIERVERGLPAERAGILPGDYIIFVDKHNVVMMPEIDILNLIRSYGSQLTLEIFRRNPSRNGSVPSVHQKSTTIVTPNSIRTDSTVNLPSCATTAPTLRRPSTVCSTNTASVDFRRRKLNLPQVTFSSEKTSTSPEESRRRAIYQLIAKEQQYATALQFAVTRFVSALAERRDLITPSEHKTLFQNVEEILRLTEDLLDHLVHEDGEMDTGMLVKVYRCKLHEITSAYKKYCFGIKKADCVLANKTKNSGSDFVRFIQSPTIPRRRPDLTSFIHKPLEHYREVLKLLMAVQNHTPPKHEDYPVINQIVHEMQVAYREITSEAGLMEPCGEGRPLLSVQDLESRLVFTKCKPFVLNKPGRQWIFGGDLSRVEGRNVRQYWTLLFSDLLLFAKASRDRVLFISEEPLPLAHVTDMFFNIRKKDTEFRICVNADAQKDASSPTVHCGPDLTRTPRKNAGKKTVILRAPTTELKAVWQNLLQRQIFQLNSGTDGSSLGSPMDSPLDVPIHSSVGTLQSMETSSFRHRQVRLLHGNVAFFDTTTTTTTTHQSNTVPDCPSSSSFSPPKHPKQSSTVRSGRVRISSEEFESLFGSSSPTSGNVFSMTKRDRDDAAAAAAACGHPESIKSRKSSPLTSNNSTTGFFSSCKVSPRFLSSTETPSTLDSSSFYNRSPSDDVFAAEEPHKLSIGDAPSPSAILTPSTEISDDSEDESFDDKVLDLRDDLWDVTQFDYDLSCLNVDGMSQLSGKNPGMDDF